MFFSGGLTSQDAMQHNVLLDPKGVPAKWHLNPNSLSRGMNVTDRQTDWLHYKTM